MDRNAVINVIQHPGQDFDCISIVNAVHAKTSKLIIDLGNKYLSAVELTTARQIVKAINVFLVDFLPSRRNRPSLNLIHGDIREAGKYKPIGSLAECAALLSQFDNWLKLQYKDRSRETRNRHRSGLRWWIQKLATEGVLPQGLKLKNEPKKGDQHSDARSTSKTLVDFSLPDEALKDLQELVYRSTCDDRDWQEAQLLYSNIARELNQTNQDIASADVPAIVAQVLADRLDVIRTHAEDVFQSAKEKRLNGLCGVRKGVKLLPLFDAFMSWEKGRGQGKTNPHRYDVYSLSVEDFENGILAWCWYRNGGIFWRHGYHDANKYNRYNKARKAVGSALGAEVAQELIGCSRDMLIAAQIIMVHDFTANVSSVRDLTIHDNYETIAGLTGVLAYKKRSGRTQTLLDVVQSDQTPPSEVARVVKNATRQYRKHCIPSDASKLFLMSYQNFTHAKGRASDNPISRPSDDWFNNHAKAAIRVASENGWNGTTKSVRQSILLLDALTGGVSAVQGKAQHERTATSTAYSNKLAKRIQLDAEIREFLRWLQTLVAVNVEDFASKMGLDEEEFAKQKAEILNSHFGGLYCKDPKEGVQPGTTKGEVCGEVSQCMLCKNRNHLFVASEGNLIHMLLWNRALIKAYESGRLGDELAREWKMWGYFIREVLSKVESDVAYKAVLAGAKVEADKVEAIQNPYDEYFSSQALRCAS